MIKLTNLRCVGQLKINDCIYSKFNIKQQLLLAATSTVAVKLILSFSNEAKPFDELSCLNSLKMMRKFLPGGKYSQLDATELMLLLKDDLGPIARVKGIFGRPDMVYTHNPKDFEKIFRNEGIYPARPISEALCYHRSVRRKEYFQGVEGILATQGEQWKSVRSAVNTVLSEPNTKLYMHKMDQLNTKFVQRILKIRDSHTLEVPDNFLDLITRWTLESLAVVALNQQLGLLTRIQGHSESEQLFDFLKDYFTYAAAVECSHPIWKYYNRKAFKKLMTSLDGLMDITEKYVNVGVESLKKHDQYLKTTANESVLEQLIRIDLKMAMVLTMDMLMAGVDTTASAFAGLLLCLAKNPEKQTKLRKEVLKLLPSKDSPIDETILPHMPYIRACIKESLRLYPVKTINARIIPTPLVLSGHQIPQGTQVIMTSVSLLQNENYFVEAKKFIPERWLLSPENRDLNTPRCHSGVNYPLNNFIYLPFGNGPRSCLGRHIVELELQLGIARLVRNFHIEFNYSTANAFKSLLINVPNIPLRFKFKDIE